MASKSPCTDRCPSPPVVETVEEITMLYRSLPPRPSIEEVEAALSVIETVNSEEQQKLEEISKQECQQELPEELFYVLKEMKKNMVLFRSYEQRKEASQLAEVYKMFQTFDHLIQRASFLVSGDTQKDNTVVIEGPAEKFGSETMVEEGCVTNGREDGDLEKGGFKGLVKRSSTKPAFFSGEGETEKLSLMKVAAVIETSAKTEAMVLDLKGKLMDRIEWLPLSIGRLCSVTEIDLSENMIMALPNTITSLKALRKLDVHSNQLINLPDSFGQLINLTQLDLHANKFKSLPSSFGNLTNLVELDLSSNQFGHLPESLGELASLKTLNAETNDLEEIPYTIGNCSSLVELRLDFNELRALPEAIGKLGNLEILTLHYNRVRGLPTTIGNLSNLRELDVCFNELESIPENLCFASSLKILNVSNNFADLTELPRSIGNLEMLEVLDISDDQIKVLPDSFRFLSKLRVFRADETPLQVPPRQVLKLGAQAVVEFMTEHVAKREVKLQPAKKKKKGFWCRVCFIFWPFIKNSQ